MVRQSEHLSKEMVERKCPSCVPSIKTCKWKGLGVQGLWLHPWQFPQGVMQLRVSPSKMAKENGRYSQVRPTWQHVRHPHF